MSNLSNISNIKDILSRHGFKFSKSLGQNFLINPSVCPKMAEFCGASTDTCVLEIGPGIGVLTYELAKRAKKVVSIELDKKLLPVLEETLADFNNVKIINADALNIDINKIIKTEFGDSPVSICANLPYYITSPIILKLLKEKLPITSLTVMIQKEAAKRICTKPGNSGSDFTSLSVNYYSEPEILFNVSRGSFIPSPNVDSTVIKLNIRKKPCVNVKNETLFFKVIKAGFSKKRKTIVNCLSSVFKLDKLILIDMFNYLDICPNKRAEELTLKIFADITNELENILQTRLQK